MSYYVLPELPYARNALEPQISEETINYHYGMHHQTQILVLLIIYSYVNNLNKLLPEGGVPLEELIMTAEGGVFNNAAQVWNHSFYWKVHFVLQFSFQCLCPNGKQLEDGPLKTAIQAKWGSVDGFIEEFAAKTVAFFGSGWSWLVKKADGSLDIVCTSNAANPLRGIFLFLF